MRYVDEFRDREMMQGLADLIRRESVREVRLMEVCGTHTMSIARHGIRKLLPDSIRLISGPGCPVCVTPQVEVDRFIEIGRQPSTILATFGDMLRVPGYDTNLEVERARGADVRVVYSPLDAVSIAQVVPDKRVVFFGVGFETTTPSIALAVLEARRLGLANFLVLTAHKLIPPAMLALAGDTEAAIDGFICPGHVSAIIGSDAYGPIARDCGIPCVVAGFEPLDILQSILMLVKQVAEGRSEVEVQYSRAVSGRGNEAARRCVSQVFEPTDAEWRGIGTIPRSGLKLGLEFAEFNASRFAPEVSHRPSLNAVCECGAILKGLKSPADCKAFGAACTPEQPLGPCMVSTEGACAAEYRYAQR